MSKLFYALVIFCGSCALVLGMMATPLYAQGGAGIPVASCSNCWGGCNTGTVEDDQSCKGQYDCWGITDPCRSECDCESKDPAKGTCKCFHNPA